MKAIQAAYFAKTPPVGPSQLEDLLIEKWPIDLIGCETQIINPNLFERGTVAGDCKNALLWRNRKSDGEPSNDFYSSFKTFHCC